MENNKRIQVKAKAIAWQMLDENVVILQSREAMAHELNGSAAKIWMNITGEKSVEQINNDLCAEYGLKESEILSDTSEFVSELVEKGLCQWQ